MQQIGYLLNRTITTLNNLFMKFFVYGCIAVIGILLSYYFLQVGFDYIIASFVSSNFIKFYHVIGHAFWGLLPLTLYMFFLFGKDTLASLGAGVEMTKPKHYSMIRENAPLIGLGGTMEGIAIGINSMDISAGMDVAYNSLKLSIGNAVYSSLWGIVLVLFINLIVPMVNVLWDEEMEVQNRMLKSLEKGSSEVSGLVNFLKRFLPGKTSRRMRNHHTR